MTETSEPKTQQEVVCPAKKDPAVRLFIVSAMLLAFGAWCAFDAFIKNKYPYSQYEQTGDINDLLSWGFNHFAPVILLPVGLVAGIWAILILKRVLVADDEAIGYRNKAPIRWSEVEELDASDLSSKKILRLHSEDGRTLVLDSWKLQNFTELVAKVEANVPEEKTTA